MDVRCEKCKTEYVFDDDRVNEAGVTVRCTECDHVFKVRREGSGEPEPSQAKSVTEPQSRPWLLRKKSGETFAFESLSTLHSWIVERRVHRSDAISRSGASWKELGDISELDTFFHVVDQADLAAREAAVGTPPATPPATITAPAAAAPPAGTPPSPAIVPSTATPPSPAASPPVGASALPAAGAPHGRATSDPVWTAAVSSPDEALGELEDEDFEEFRRGGAGKWVVSLLLVVAAGGGVFYFLDPDRALDLIGLGEGATEVSAEIAGDEGVEGEGAEGELARPEVEPVSGEQAGGAGESVPSQVDAAEGTAAGTEGVAAPAPTAETTTAAETTPAAEASPAVETPTAARPAPAQPTFEGLLRQALAARNRGQIETALDRYADASRIRPNRAEPYAGQGFCYIEMRAWHAAIAAFEQALEHNSRFGDAIIGLAEAHRLQGNTQQAKRFYERYLSLYPNGPEAAVAQTNLERM